jgi:LuxR family maltose regulon positive regulatory protein
LHEVFFQQGQDLQNFLLQTSILERFNSMLCDELLGREDSQRLIDELDQRNLFLIPLDGSRHWFRYHHLFSEFLRDRLTRDWAQQDIEALHRRAANWYEAQGLIEEAVQQSFQIEEYAEIARLIASLPINFLYEAGGSIKLVDWGLRLPKKILAQFPMAGVMLVGAALITGNAPVRLEYFELIKHQESVRPYLDLFNSVQVRNEKGDHVQALKLALQATSASQPLDPSFAPMAWMQVAVNYGNLGQLEDVDEAVSKMVQSIKGENALTLNMRIYAAEIQVLSTLAQGEYQKAEQICLSLVDTATDGERVLSPLVGIIYSYLGSIYYQWNDLPAAQLYFEKCIHMARQSGISDIFIYSNVLQANLAAALKDKTALQQALESFASFANNVQLERMQFVSARMAAWFWLRIGELDKAVEWVRQAPNTLTDEPEFDDFDTYHTLVAVCLEENRRARGKHNPAEMLAMVEKLEHLAVVSHHQVELIDALNLKALLLDYQRNRQATDVIQRALELAKPSRLIRIFLEWGTPMRELLVQAVSVDPAYVGQLLKAFDAEPDALDSGMESVQLTARENEILQLIAAGLPNKQIEETLLISKNTVRTHIKNLYNKLDVNSRTQAVQKARQLALLD